MRVCVINLEGSLDRRANIRAQLDPLGVPYTFFKAIEPEHGRDYFAGYDEALHLKNTGRTASPTEIACFASHRVLWEESVAAGEPLVILEDDAQVLPSFPLALAETARSIGRYRFIRLQDNGSSRHVRTIPTETAGDFSVAYYASYPFGSMGYAIDPAVAAAFVERSRVLAGPVDLFIKRFWEHGQPLFGLSPYPIRASRLVATPTIVQREKAKLDARLRAARIVNKLEARIARWRFNSAFQASRRAAADRFVTRPGGPAAIACATRTSRSRGKSDP